MTLVGRIPVSAGDKGPGNVVVVTHGPFAHKHGLTSAKLELMSEEEEEEEEEDSTDLVLAAATR